MLMEPGLNSQNENFLFAVAESSIGKGFTDIQVVGVAEITIVSCLYT